MTNLNLGVFKLYKVFYRYVMGKIQMKKVKSIESVAEENMNIRRFIKQRKFNAISDNSIAKQNEPSSPICVINKLDEDDIKFLIDNKFENMKIVSSKKTVLSIENDNTINITNDDNVHENDQIVSSKVTVPNIISDDIIDITDTIIDDNPHKKNQLTTSKVTTPNIESNDIVTIDITGTTMDSNKHKSCKPSNETVSSMSDDDVQIVSHTVDVGNKVIDFITISDNSDEENIPCQQSVERPVSFKPIKDRIGVSSNSKAIKKSYIKPLRNHKKMLKGGNMPRQGFLSIGEFVINKQSISPHSRHLSKFDHKAVIFPEQHESSSSTTSRKLRPIIIDGLNIGHA